MNVSNSYDSTHLLRENLNHTPQSITDEKKIFYLSTA